MIKKWLKKRVVPGGFVWHALVFPQRLRRHGLKILRGRREERAMRSMLEPLQGRQFRRDHVSVVITSAGRKEYLQKAVESLQQYFDYPQEKVSWLIIDDYPDSQETRDYIKSLDVFDVVLLNEQNRGLGYSLNRIFAEVQTEFVFYCQDDFELLRRVSVRDMIEILRNNSYLRQLLLSGNKRLVGTKDTKKGYLEYYKMFGFWPHLASMEFFRKHLPFPLYFTNVEFSFRVQRKGWRVSGIFGEQEKPYVRHIGEKRNVWVIK